MNKTLLMLPVLAALMLTTFRCGQKNELVNVAAIIDKDSIHNIMLNVNIVR